MGSNILFIDLETSYNTVATFYIGSKVNINHEQILEERKIICACWKWAGDKTVRSENWGLTDQSDYGIIETLRPFMEEADLIIGHNGDKFDIPWLHTRNLYHGGEPLPPITSIDTLKLARNHFYFNSNRLDYISKYLGFKGKNKMSLRDWVDIVEYLDHRKLDKMVAYCKRDVLELEKIFNKLKPHVKLPALFAHLDSDNKCTDCGSKKLHYRGYLVTKSFKYRRFRCTKCGKWGKERTRVK